ncbi:MAG: isoprenoid biosynthesis protein ElbB [Candidatus Lindowbacteria bacterium RIFCSPLOWO2_12_FULL_62_27]|nr:MAG: isoprenoid biosynthesis protein ElbB [Candidatus Lindowbacteria bacterium RIFCSPLOWO2_12_FULL_62_27]OGH61914.1 MAG: isoprenoid biosynthesis protein ElbB [Candidatus Lindowbacteria bacterium RIFCSPLOWO2_02_FULL_62_12]
MVLSGCGVFDGSEIHESVLTLLALDRAGAQAVCMAPNKNQSEVINHLTAQVSHETRNVLVESARIARGQIRDIREVRASDLDAVILPGGYGAVKNLSNFVWNGDRCWIDGEVYRLLREMFDAKKPIGAVCIAPAVIAKTFAAEKPRLTIGMDEGTAQTLARMGARHEKAQVDEIVIDESLLLVSTPAYMLAGRISEAADGIDRLVQAILRRAGRRQADSSTASLAGAGRIAQRSDSAVSRMVARSRRAQPADSAVAAIARSDRQTGRTRGRASRPGPRRRAVRA